MFLISQSLWVRDPKVVSLGGSVSGSVGRLQSPDVGLGFRGAKDLIARWLPAMTVGKRGQQWGFDTERRPSKPR